MSNKVTTDKKKEKLSLDVPAKSVEFRPEFFNLFNHVNFDNPVSNLNAAEIDSTTGQIITPGDFGRIISTSNNPRLIQFALKLNF